LQPEEKHMAVIVQKYGGSSVADVAKIGDVADRVVEARRGGDDVVVVVSAMGKTTDGLLDLARAAAQRPLPGGEAMDPPRRELDMLVSTGERVSMALLSIAIQARGHEAISFTGSQSGILTTDRHFDARIVEVRPHRIEEELSRGKIVIVAGYQGMSHTREITTLGRGGSDTTAVALAAALSAERCEIYSDVDGVYSADPRVVDQPHHLPELGLEVLAEMSEAGAKVLNAQAVEWARKAGVVLHARKTSDARGKGRETIARNPVPGLTGTTRATRAVVGMDRVIGVRIGSRAFGHFVQVAAELELPLLDVSWTNGGYVGDGADPTGQDPLAHASIPLLNLPDWATLKPALLRGLARVSEATAAAVTLEDERALVSVVGSDMSLRGQGLPRFLEALARAGVRPLTVTASPLRIGATIRSADLAVAQRALHAAFVEIDA
jgi:aspartate kinase